MTRLFSTINWYFHFWPSLFSPVSSNYLLPTKKGEGKLFEFLVYFRFLSAQNAATPIIQATATAAMMATSVVINGVSVAGCSGSIGVEGDAAGSTLMAVSANDA